MKIILLLINLSILFCVGCSTKQGNWKNPNTIEESVLVVPDSVASKEQIELKAALLELVYSKVIVVDNRLVLDVDAAYLPTVGISTSYYKIINLSLKETNDGIRKWDMDIDVAKLFEEAKNEYLNGAMSGTIEAVDTLK